jgi:siroheme synthase
MTASPFILRFEESCAKVVTDSDATPVTMGTRTETFVAAEASDPDRTSNDLTAFPAKSSILVGTQTLTNVRSEAGDHDPRETACAIIPR